MLTPVALPSITPTASPSPGDTTPPVTTAGGMGFRWRNDTATVVFTATDDASGVAATVCRVDGGDWRIGTQVKVKAPKDHSNDGEHTVEFYSVDNALNRETPKAVTVRIDTQPPRFAWTGLSPGIVRRVQPVTCAFTVSESSGPVRVSYKVTDQYGYPAVSRGGLQRAAGPGTLQVPTRYSSGAGFVPGVYRIRITVRDEAGNTTVSRRRSFRDCRPLPGGVWYSIPGAGRLVALTFDDGGAAAWQSMLDTLRRYGMHATFFPLGSYVAASPSLARRCVAEGNAVGTHGWTHSLMTYQSTSQVQSEWTRSAAVWWSKTGYSPVPYCRPPGGAVDAATTSASAAIGFCRVVLWDVDPQDWTRPGASVIAARVLAHVHPGAIVCLHLLPQTAAALPAILSGLKARGFRCASLPEMFRAAGMR